MIRFVCLLIVILMLGACGGGNTERSNIARSTEVYKSLMLNDSHGDNGSAWGLSDCSACHKLSALHQQVDNIRTLVRLRGYATCAGCHGSNGSRLQRQCLICHNSVDLPVTPRQQGAHHHGFMAEADNAVKHSDCLACHYSSDMNGQFELNVDLTRLADARKMYPPYSGISDFCLRCHNRDHQQPEYPINRQTGNILIAIEDAWNYIDKHGRIDGLGNRIYAGLRKGYSYASRVACTDCHAMHGTDNLQLIIDSSDTGVSLLEHDVRNTPYTISVAGGDYSQLCVLCHAMETISEQGDVDTGNQLSGVHATGSDCLTCHRHGEAVQAGL
ncbi:MAG TPA: hypothetical protein ENJ28_07780 [Gammaproteobacteria bacterium]|nr:hypothetical protein [Gammaproteobacteria bacterium]